MRFSFLATVASLALSQAAEYNGVTDRWSFDMELVRNPSWMSTVADNTVLSKLSIPGTHNSMTNRIGKIELQSQRSSLKVQLHSGIRYFDISGRIINNDLKVYHRNTPTGYNFADVFSTIFGFLDANPREVVILRIQKEHYGDRSTNFNQILKTYLTSGTPLGNAAVNRVYYPSGDITRIPTLGELRGRVLILQDFKQKKSFSYVGIPWLSPTVLSFSFRPSLGNILKGLRWGLVKRFIQTTGLKAPDTLYITHTSVSIGARPIDIAGGGSGVDDVGMNRYLGEYLQEGNTGRISVIAMDFPGAYLINAIIRLNTPFGAPQPIDPGAANPGSNTYTPAPGAYPPPVPDSYAPPASGAYPPPVPDSYAPPPPGAYPPPVPDSYASPASGAYPPPVPDTYPPPPGLEVYPPPPPAPYPPPSGTYRDTPADVYPPPPPHAGLYPPPPNDDPSPAY